MVYGACFFLEGGKPAFPRPGVQQECIGVLGGVCVLRTAGVCRKDARSRVLPSWFCVLGGAARELGFHSWLVILPNPEA